MSNLFDNALGTRKNGVTFVAPVNDFGVIAYNSSASKPIKEVDILSLIDHVKKVRQRSSKIPRHKKP